MQEYSWAFRVEEMVICRNQLIGFKLYKATKNPRDRKTVIYASIDQIRNMFGIIDSDPDSIIESLETMPKHCLPKYFNDELDFQVCGPKFSFLKESPVLENNIAKIHPFGPHVRINSHGMIIHYPTFNFSDTIKLIQFMDRFLYSSNLNFISKFSIRSIPKIELIPEEREMPFGMDTTGEKLIAYAVTDLSEKEVEKMWTPWLEEIGAKNISLRYETYKEKVLMIIEMVCFGEMTDSFVPGITLMPSFVYKKDEGQYISSHGEHYSFDPSIDVWGVGKYDGDKMKFAYRSQDAEVFVRWLVSAEKNRTVYELHFSRAQNSDFFMNIVPIISNFNDAVTYTENNSLLGELWDVSLEAEYKKNRVKENVWLLEKKYQLDVVDFSGITPRDIFESIEETWKESVDGWETWTWAEHINKVDCVPTFLYDAANSVGILKLSIAIF